MKPVDQSNVSFDRGDCQRAVIASIFELELEQVPNFLLFGKSKWFHVYFYFLYAMGYEYHSEVHFLQRNKEKFLAGEYLSIDGYYIGSIKSKTFENLQHSVVIDKNGFIVHDPNPNKRCQGLNVFDEIAPVTIDVLGKVEAKRMVDDE